MITPSGECDCAKDLFTKGSIFQLQWNVDLTKRQGTEKLARYIEGLLCRGSVPKILKGRAEEYRSLYQ